MSLTFPGYGRDHVQRRAFAHTEFWSAICERVHGTRQGGCKILVDSENSALGSGKTSAAVALARACAKAFGYNLEEEDFTLSGAEYLKRYREHPGREQPSVIVLDELVNAGAADARRSMSTSNLGLARMWGLARVKRVVTICTLPDFSDVDTRMLKLADFRFQVLEKPVGTGRAYKIGTFFDGRSDVKFRRLDEGSRIHFPDVNSHDDPFYEHLDGRKGELLASRHMDADDLHDDEDDTEEDEEDEEPSLKDIADKIMSNGGLDEVISEHGQTGEPYINDDLIRAEHELSNSDARAVKALLEKRVDIAKA